MWSKVLGVMCCLGFFIIFNEVCRMSASYFPKNKLKKYIIIKNRVLAKILIASCVSREKFVNPEDSNKMCILGLISYIVITPINMFNLIISIVFSLGINRSSQISNLSNVVIGMVIVISFIFMVVMEINTKNSATR